MPERDRRFIEATADRVSRFLTAVRPALSGEITVEWLVTSIVKFDGGPRLTPRQLGPALRAAGLRIVRHRRGNSRHKSWLLPTV